MSKDALKILTIKYLRGAVVPFTLPFEKGKNLTLVYGENATGKSTICDAFEFLGKGRVGSLENRGLGRTNRYWVSLGKKATEVSVTLESGSYVCHGRISGAGVVVEPPEERPSVEVLRRSQILALIEARPAERYATISKFIDVSEAEASESALRDLIRTIERSSEVAVARVQENSDSIQRFWEEAGSSPPDPILWAVNESKRDQGEFDADIKAIGELSEAYSKLKNLPEQLEVAEQVEIEALDAQVVAKGALKECLLTVAGDAVETVSLLEAAKTYFEKNGDTEACPLCESTENAEGLRVEIEEKL